METNETYYLVQYSDSYGGRKNEGVFTNKGWKKYIKEENEMRDEEDKWEENMEECQELGQFIFTEIEVYN
jgi:hypothetical protein